MMSNNKLSNNKTFDNVRSETTPNGSLVVNLSTSRGSRAFPSAELANARIYAAILAVQWAEGKLFWASRRLPRPACSGLMRYDPTVRRSQPLLRASVKWTSEVLDGSETPRTTAGHPAAPPSTLPALTPLRRAPAVPHPAIGRLDPRGQVARAANRANRSTSMERAARRLCFTLPHRNSPCGGSTDHGPGIDRQDRPERCHTSRSARRFRRRKTPPS